MSLSVSIIQTDVAWENKRLNLEKLHEKIKALPPTDLVLLPEMFSTGFSMNPEYLAETMEGDTVQWMRNVAAEFRIVLIGSLIITEGGKYFNRLICMLPGGDLGYYDKRHLFAFAGENEQYTPGYERLIASVKGWRINFLICYDLRFPVWARQQATDDAPEYDVLIYVANWPERRSHAWKSLLVARAIENQCYCIGVNRVGRDGNDIMHSGDSMIVEPAGEIIWQKEFEEDTCTITLFKDELQRFREKFPFWKDADRFSLPGA